MTGKKFQEGKTYTYEALKFYAMNGGICIHDERDGDFQVVTRREFLHRAEALTDEVRRLSSMSAENGDKAKQLYELRTKYQNQIEQMIACCMEAKEQGDHDDPEVSAWFRKHKPWARSRSRANSGAANFEIGKAGKLPRGRRTGRTTEPGIPLQQLQARPVQKRLILPEGLL